MSINVDAAEQFILANARLVDRHRLAVLLHGASAAPVLQALRAYRNADGGFGHALEPDVRAPESEPASTLHALEVLAEIGALADPMVRDATSWIGTIADPDGGVPFVLPTAAAYPHAPWMVPTRGGSHLTFAGSIPVAGGTENEKLTPMAISPWPGRRSRVLFTDSQIDADLDRMERGQQDDGGWTFDWLGWSPGQSVEWRGAITLRSLATLAANGRI